MKNNVQRRKVDTQNELLACIMDSAARTKKQWVHIRPATRDLRTRGAECIEFDGGIFEHLLWAVTDLSFEQ
jgi:hypothetical protein